MQLFLHLLEFIIHPNVQSSQKKKKTTQKDLPLLLNILHSETVSICSVSKSRGFALRFQKEATLFSFGYYS